jgi:hypothetical protein
MTCELHPAILRERDQLLPALKLVFDSNRLNATVRRSEGGWVADIR